MFHPLLTACAAALALASAQAAASTAAPRPDDAAAPVPETRYHAPRAYKPVEPRATTPDRHWIEANRTVSGYNSMMLTMPERPAPRPLASSQPSSEPSSSPQPAPPAAPQPANDHGAHAGHGKEGHH